MRESPALKIIDLLVERGAEVVYHDTFVPEHRRQGCAAWRWTRVSRAADLAVIVTAHPGVDHEAIARRAPLTVDLRGVTRSLGLEQTRQL